ncbi:MAG: Peptidase, T4 family [Pseudolabrys sp.]|jgi:L-aminopeptidase/D-esterase-like protein|nr:Peptidase, T4 family [Pseudolabrys sp.]
MALRNLITDIAGVTVGHAEDRKLASGVTVVLFDRPAVASVDVRGGGSGTRETALLDPAQTVEGIDAIALSGGSAFGLDAASGVQALLRERGRGFHVRSALVPIVPGAILFDLLNGGDKDWGQYPPYRELGYSAARGAGVDFALGSAGAGLGATTANLKGGVGSASAVTPDGITVGAVAVVNAVGTAVIGDGPYFWAAPFEHDGEFGNLGLPARLTERDIAIRAKGAPASVPGENTTLAVIATDAKLTKAQCHRLAVMAADGYARALYPVHSPLDGDIIFAASAGDKPLADPHYALAELGLHAGNVMARAVARGVYEATALPFAGALPSWKDQFGRR